MASLTTTKTKCSIFVDDSNLWIAGKKAQAKKLVDADEDSRFRVDLGRFLHLLAQGRIIAKAFLYGSVPPTNDSVWKAAKENNYEVKTFQRSESGQEKEVDTAISRDITKILWQMILGGGEGKDNAVFIIVTGDRDLKPPIDDVLENQVPVELWSWEHSIAHKFKQLANTHHFLFTIKLLDEVQSAFSYPAILKTRQEMDIDPAHAVVYKNVPQGRAFQKKLIAHINCLKRLFYIIVSDFEKEGKQDLIIQFPHTKPEVVLKQLSQLKSIGYQPCSYPEYASSLEKLTNNYKALCGINKDVIPEAVQLDTSLTESINETGMDSINTSDNWITVVRKKTGKKARQQRRRETQCCQGDHCEVGYDCPYKHTDYERKLFEKHRKLPFKFLKTRECARKDKHTSEEDRKWCTFAHVDKDSWCLKCKMYGHLTNECKA